MKLFFLLLICALQVQAAEFQFLPGASRAVTNSLSASRDMAYPTWQLLPRETRVGGIDFGIIGLKLPHHSFRVGHIAMLELESDKYDVKPVPLKNQNVNLWRGSYGLTAAWSLDAFGKQTLGERSKFEIGLTARHESDHESDHQNERYALVPHIGDYLMPEVATRVARGRMTYDLRLQNKIFVVKYGYRGYDLGPGGDFIVRYAENEKRDWFVSNYYEYVFGGKAEVGGVWFNVPDYRYFRQLAGVLFKTDVADLAFYTAWTAGHGKGKLVYDDQVGWGWGFRVVFFE